MGERIDSMRLPEPLGASFCAICPSNVDEKVLEGYQIDGQIRLHKRSECQALQSLPIKLDVAALLNNLLPEALPDASDIDAPAHV